MSRVQFVASRSVLSDMLAITHTCLFNFNLNKKLRRLQKKKIES